MTPTRDVLRMMVEALTKLSTRTMIEVPEDETGERMYEICEQCACDPCDDNCIREVARRALAALGERVPLRDDEDFRQELVRYLFRQQGLGVEACAHVSRAVADIADDHLFGSLGTDATNERNDR
jgi:hypothetical protein